MSIKFYTGVHTWIHTKAQFWHIHQHMVESADLAPAGTVAKNHNVPIREQQSVCLDVRSLE